MTRPSCSPHLCPLNDRPLMNDASPAEMSPGLTPFSLNNAPSFIERQFPVGRISAEAYKERTANLGQTLTGLGSYWKGRKPLILVRAVVLGCLLPATNDAGADLDVFLKLMAMDDGAFGRRYDGNPAAFAKLFPNHAHFVTEVIGRRTVWRDDLSESRRRTCISEALSSLPYADRLRLVRRPEECDQSDLLAPIWDDVNSHLDTRAQSLAQLVEQLGIARFGRRPKVGDAFCGGGSIPFEAARLGSDVYAADLNPIACMLTWGAFNIIGGSAEQQSEIIHMQEESAGAIDERITKLGIEHDSKGNRAKAYLYCLETRCPKTGWMVPMAPSWVISRTRNVVAKLIPDLAKRHYNIAIETGVSEAEMAEALAGTIRDGRLVHPMNPEKSGVEIKTIRGDYRDIDGVTRSRLRPWGKNDFVPKRDDIFQERLYCIQWIRKDYVGKARPETYFAAATDEDLTREHLVEEIVAANLARWQDEGLVPDMPIQPGENTTQPMRERGWTYWHHLFPPRHLLMGSVFAAILLAPRHGNGAILLARLIDRMSRLCRWYVGSPARPGVAPAGDFAMQVFSNQALNTFYNFACRSTADLLPTIETKMFGWPIRAASQITTRSANESEVINDYWITDPPYADAINYHEITEYFIAWLRKNPPFPFADWTWDSRRDLAIRGKDEHFRREMVNAFAAMVAHMAEHGMQVVMFTHQDVTVWAELGGILWAAGLKVTAAWNIATERASALREGNFVQGTICLALRRRVSNTNARRMEIEAEIEATVAAQLARLHALDDSWHERTNSETLYTDGDLTLAAYAAALQVVTAYSTIDRQPLDRDLYRKLAKNETTMLRDLVDYAAQVANSLLVPEGFPKDVWRDLGAGERFYVRMLDMEAKGSAKVADFQNFARSFAFGGYTELMASTAANAAALAGAADLKGHMLSGEGFWGTQLRQVLFATWKTMEGSERDPKRGVTILKTEYAADYWQRRQKLIAFATYVALKTQHTRPDESAAAGELAEALKLDRV
jgi:putative DNA methylase